MGSLNQVLLDQGRNPSLKLENWQLNRWLIVAQGYRIMIATEYEPVQSSSGSVKCNKSLIQLQQEL